MKRIMTSALGIVGIFALVMMASVAQAAVVSGKVVEVKDNGVMVVEQADGERFEAKLWGVNLDDQSPVSELVKHLTTGRQLNFAWSAHKAVEGQPVNVRVRYPEGGSVQRDLLLSGFATVSDSITASPLYGNFMKWQRLVEPIHDFMETRLAAR